MQSSSGKNSLLFFVLIMIVNMAMLQFSLFERYNKKNVMKVGLHKRPKKNFSLPVLKTEIRNVFLDISKSTQANDLSEHKLTDCSIWKLDNDSSSNEPQIVLDPNRFLFPGLHHGPNNQLLALEKTIFMSIVTNR